MNDIGNGRNFPPRHPSLLFKVKSWLLINGLIYPAIHFLMRILNRTRLIGIDRIKRLDGPYFLMSNHISLLDDLFLGPIVFGPYFLRPYRYFPYHAPEERNFYKYRLISWFMRMTKSIPVLRGKGLQQEGVDRLIAAVREGGILHIYPEGTRTRNGDIGPVKAGIGRIVYESGAPVVPMYHQGLEHVLPIGKGVPRIGRQIYVAIGEPIRFDTELKMDNSPATWRIIAGKVMDAIREQREIVQKTWGVVPVYNGSQLKVTESVEAVEVESQ
ncbi:MAG: 1-acyl-sn-glycerol-3-phosphate acyltransferase [Calditrichaeota bacterium]|nr:1-acyl-sn-glycerol-3-phosphate acyltransferase [Calditrichota bacterium]